MLGVTSVVYGRILLVVSKGHPSLLVSQKLERVWQADEVKGPKISKIQQRRVEPDQKDWATPNKKISHLHGIKRI